VRARFQAFAKRIDDNDDQKARMSRKVTGGAHGSPGVNENGNLLKSFWAGSNPEKKIRAARAVRRNNESRNTRYRPNRLNLFSWTAKFATRSNLLRQIRV
jgi:hypothetical protein